MGSGHAHRYCQPYSHSADYATAGLKESWKGFGERRQDTSERHFAVQDASDYPDGRDIVPLTWEYYGMEFPMEFVSGFMGFTQDIETRAVMPIVSWYLLDKTPTVKLEEKDMGDPETIVASLREQLKAVPGPCRAGPG